VCPLQSDCQNEGCKLMSVVGAETDVALNVGNVCF